MIADQWCETSWAAAPGSFVGLMTLYESNYVRLRWLVSDLRAITIRSVSRVHREHPFVLRVGNEEFRVDYDPAEGTTGLFGGNSNWRGPVWFPMNYLLVEALERYHHFYGDSFQLECPTGSGQMMTLQQVALEISQRLSRIFLANASGHRPCHGGSEPFANDPHWRDLVLFYEYFHGDNGRGVGASHQTGWTALVTRLLGSHGSGTDREHRHSNDQRSLVSVQI